MLTFIVSISFAQYTPMTAAGYQFKRILCDSTLHIPSFCGIPTLRNSTAKNGAIAMDTCNYKIYMWTNAGGWGEIIGAGTDTTSLSLRIDQRVKYTDTAQMLLAYLRKQDTANKWVANVTRVNDTTIRVFKGNTITDLKILGKQTDTTSLSNRIDQKLGKADSTIYYTKYRSDTSRTNIYNAINTKLSKSDSTIFYTKYRSDTSRTNIYNAINQKLNITDTTNKWVNNVTKVNDSTIRIWKGATSTTIELPRGSGGGGGGTGTVYNVSTGYALSGGPINTTGTIIVDSATLSTKYLRRADTSNLVATKSNLALKLNISDTATMLSKYLRKVDTLSLSNRINLKLNIADTSNKWVNNVTKKNDSTITVFKGATATDITLPRGSTGSVTNVGTGYGLSGGPITSTGTIIVDSATLSTKYLRRADTSNLVATKSNLSLKLNISDTTNKFVNNVTKINDTSFRVWKGTTSTVVAFAKDVVYTQSPIMSMVSNDSNIIYFNPDTANAWRGGSGSTPNLQQVTDIGDSTTTDLLIGNNLKITDDASGTRDLTLSSYNSGNLTVIRNAGFQYELEAQNLTNVRQYELPDADGKLLLDAPANGSLYGRKNNAWEVVSGGGGGGTVTSVATGYGLSGGIITNTGTLIADTSVSGLSGKYLRFADTSNMLIPYPIGSGAATTVAFWNNTRSLTNNSQIAIDNSSPTSPSLQIRASTGTTRSFMNPTYSGVQYDATNYAINNISTTTPSFINHEEIINRESRLYSNSLQFSNLSTSGFVTLKPPTSFNNRTYTLPDSSGTIALNDYTVNSISRTAGKDSIIFYVGYTRYAIKDSVGTATGFVPYTGATADVDLGIRILSSQSLRVTGTNGVGDLHLRHQATDATATGQSTSLFADANGDLKYKNAGNFYTTLKTSTNTADRTYTYPNATTTLIGAADTSVFQRKSISSYTLMANNTNAAANATAQIFRDTAGTYAGTITWTGTAPTTQTINAYQWQQTGKMVRLQLFGYYTNVGSALTSVSLTIPADCPAPDISMFTSGALAILYQGIGGLGLSNTSLTTTTNAYMRRNAANNGNELLISAASANYRRYQIDITYRAQ